ncbi:hypothetical protein JAAARDRAFT_31456 [Jaapia argillacea MUCL 33604]|uniref:Uncharacterized protein n=1 Tax=Jaapia argillacea MUCL 33604 TaxID=933084 RepID=A0A067QHB5_9AGAM|nr:hypothetical protein JAAARDRAFT_31456 [Jaapia argillacea MUCL 33604]
MAKVLPQLLSPLSFGCARELGDFESHTQNPEDRTSLVHYESVKCRLQRSDEANVFLRAHTEHLKAEAHHLKAQLLSLQFRMLRQDLLHCAQQARHRKSEQELQFQLRQSKSLISSLQSSLSELEASTSSMSADMERMNFGMIGSQFVIDRLTQRSEDLKVKLDEEKEENRRLRERLDLLEEYVTASREADELVSETFDGVLATLDAWKKGDESEVEDDRVVRRDGDVTSSPEAGSSTCVDDESTLAEDSDEDDRTVEGDDVFDQQERKSWTHQALLDSWTSTPDAAIPTTPIFDESCVPLPSSPAELGLDLEASPTPSQATITPSSPTSDEESDYPFTYVHHDKEIRLLDIEVPTSPTVVGSGSELDSDTDTDSESHLPELPPIKAYESDASVTSIDSPLLAFPSKFIDDESFAPLIRETLSPLREYPDSDRDCVVYPISTSPFRYRRPTINSLSRSSSISSSGTVTARKISARSKVIGQKKKRGERNVNQLETWVSRSSAGGTRRFLE